MPQAQAGPCPPASSIVAYDASQGAHSYPTLQTAVTAGQPGWEILVGSGTYATGVVTISGKSNLAIRGCGQPQAQGFKLQQSSGITITGFNIDATGTASNGITLLGGNNDNQQVTISDNLIHGAGSGHAGISAARGNADLTISDNRITGNGRDGIVFIDATGGPHYLRNNTIDANGWNGVEVARQHNIVLEANTITGNGTAAGSTGGRYGVLRERITGAGDAAGIQLIDNTITCNNGNVVTGKSTTELANYDQMLDTTDTGNTLSALCGSQDTTPPTIIITAPANGLVTNQDVIPAYSVSDDFDPNPTFTITPSPPYSSDGIYHMVVTATDNSGNQSQATRDFTIDKTPPHITVTAPTDNATVAVPAVDVLGTVDDPTAVVMVNGAAATITGNAFAKPQLSLVVGPNTILVEAHDALGNSSSVSLSVTVMTASLSATLSASQDLINLGESSTLSWITTGTTALSIDQGISTAATTGSAVVSPGATTTYTLTAVGASGVLQRQVTVTVHGAVLPLPEGSFGKEYEDLVPQDATLAAYDSKRFSVVTGQVDAADGTPVPEVSVSVLNHPEYGRALTDDDGQYSLPVEGGGVLTLVLKKDGFINTQRQVDVPWNDIALVDSVVMLTEDPQSTTVTLDGNPATVFTHRSTQVVDTAGRRAATVILTGDNQAYAVSGDQELELASFAMRATEYRTEQSMPAKLPPTSGFTYCVDLAVDGARAVRFSKPVTILVDNFLGFDVGTVVPVGYYDSTQGVWIPSDNGVVVRLLDRDGDGIVDALDATGDGLPDDLNADGGLEDDVWGLQNAGRYPPGGTYWRAEVTHFTPYDLNFSTSGPPSEAVIPPSGTPDVDQAAEPSKDLICRQEVNSYVDQQSRVFHEDIAIPGTDLFLHYASDRVPGYVTRIKGSASSDSVPASLLKITVDIRVAGRQFVTELAPLPNQDFDVLWDGRDFRGALVKGRAMASIEISYAYGNVQYTLSPSGGSAFGRQGVIATSIPVRGETAMTSNMRIPVYRPGSEGDIAEGWTLSSHHQVSLSDLATLYKGDGTQSRSGASIIQTVAGGAQCDWSYYRYEGGIVPEGVPAMGACMEPLAMVADELGNTYYADWLTSSVRKIDRDGIVTTVAGNSAIAVIGEGNYCEGPLGDGGPATEACLLGPTDLALDTEGNLLIVDPSNFRIRKVDGNGTITTVAGNGLTDHQGYGIFSGDGGPATDAGLAYPRGIAADAFGNIFIADGWLVRKVDPSGIITTVAGQEYHSGNLGDGGPAWEADLDWVSDVASAPDGSLYLGGYGRIRKVSPSGIISTVAGTGEIGYAGDGGPAQDALISVPSGLALDREGTLYFVDSWNLLIRKVSANGIISTVAGNGMDSGGEQDGDGGPALEASIYPQSAMIDQAGGLLIAAGDRFRLVSIPEALSGEIGEDDLLFAEENGLGHVLSSTGSHIRTIDLNSGTTLSSFGYDSSGRIASVTGRFGDVVSILRDGNGTPYSITSPDGIATAVEVGTGNRLEAVVYPDGTRYQFVYDNGGLMIGEYDPRGSLFQHAFNDEGRLTDVFDPAGGHWNYTRTVEDDTAVLSTTLSAEGDANSYRVSTDLLGNLTMTATDASGAVSVTTQSADGLSLDQDLSCGTTRAVWYGLDTRYGSKFEKETSRLLPSGLQQTTTRSRDYQDTDGNSSTDQVTELSATNGRVWSLVDNFESGTRSLTSPLGRQVDVAYDPATLLTRATSVPGLYPVNQTHDNRGRLTGTTVGSRTTQLTYDANGNPDFIITPDNRTHDYTYDIMGRLISELRPDGSSLSFQYDGEGNMTVLTDPNQISFGFGYTANNQRSLLSAPLSGNYQYAYDKDRRLKQVLLPSGRSMTNTYSGGVLAYTTTSEGVISYDYLCASRLGSVTREGEGVSFGYDGPLVTSDTRNGTLATAVGYTYDNDFALSSMTYAGATTSYGHDDDGLLTSAHGYAISRDAQNGLPLTVSGNGMTLSRTFTGYGELDGQAATTGGVGAYDWAVSRDQAGRIISRTEHLGGETISWGYGYDQLGRLTDVNLYGAVVEHYTYDLNGNRLSEDNAPRGIAGMGYSYSAEDHVLTAGADSYQFDVDGFLQSTTTVEGTTSYVYSSRGELLRTDLPDGKIVTYLHDPLGRRIAKQVNGTTVEKYLWAGQTTLLAVYDGSDNLLQRYTYADARTPVSMTVGSATYFLLTDQVGTLRAVADSAGMIVKRIDYDSFGNIVADTNPSFNVPFGFAGGLHDRDTGLVRFGYRDYSPELGRFVAKDPIDFAGGDTNLYVYVMNDPVNFTDASGLVADNTSPFTVPVKPERDGPLVMVPPHTCYNRNIDGVKPPAWDGDWLKVPGKDSFTTDVRINPDGTPSFPDRGSGVTLVPDLGWPTDRLPGRKSEPGFSDRNSGWK